MKKLLIIVFVLSLPVIVWAYFNASNKPDFQKEITDFETCVNAGFPVLESYPPQCKTDDGKSFVQDIGNEMEYIDEITVDTPRPKTVVTSPLTVSGKAKGPWFFEASFSAELYNDVGMKLGEAILTAEGEWMTEDFMPFSGTVNFERPGTAKGTLVLKNANPSGMEENSKELRIPVVFSN